MDIILLERVGKLGHIGDVVTVKDGFARNYLLPQKKALRATEANKQYFESQRAELEAQNEERKGAAQTVAEKIDGSSYVLIRQAGETGQLYGSVSSRDIAAAASDSDVNVTRGQIVLDKPLKALGLYDVRIMLHPEVTATVQVNIARSEDEAERQARGEDILAREEDLDDDEDAVEDGALSAEDALDPEALATVDPDAESAEAEPETTES
ncbi:MAG: 50S ribosomal protein L9 [Pseudomonadota bacterium]